jgi:hypothetical protein
MPGIAGGIRGSYPFSGAYGQWCVLNWATKFFADSIMDYLEIQNSELQGTRINARNIGVLHGGER